MKYVEIAKVRFNEVCVFYKAMPNTVSLNFCVHQLLSILTLPNGKFMK